MQNVKIEAKNVDLKEMRKKKIQCHGKDIYKFYLDFFLNNMLYVFQSELNKSMKVFFMLSISSFIIVNITWQYDKRLQQNYQIVLHTVIQGVI